MWGIWCLYINIKLWLQNDSQNMVVDHQRNELILGIAPEIRKPDWEGADTAAAAITATT